MTDLEAMLQTLTVSVRPDRYTFIDVPSGAAPRVGNGVAAVISEAGSDTVVATIERAEHEGWPIDFVAAWLTLDIHSALHAVGLTAAVSAALADAGIPCRLSPRPSPRTRRAAHRCRGDPRSAQQPLGEGGVPAPHRRSEFLTDKDNEEHQDRQARHRRASGRVVVEADRQPTHNRNCATPDRNHHDHRDSLHQK